MKHKLIQHDKCDLHGHCPVCDGGLAICSVCGGAEGSLPTDCPGFKMSRVVEDQVWKGLIDFRDGEWVDPDDV